jgi:hypothetical protein
MDSKDDYKCSISGDSGDGDGAADDGGGAGSSSDGGGFIDDEFPKDLCGNITPPPHLPIDIEPTAVPDHPMDPSLTTQPPSSKNWYDSLDAATHSALAHFEEQPDWDLDRLTLPSSPRSSSPTFLPMDEETTRPVNFDKRPGNDEDALEEFENDGEKLLPEVIAPTCEAVTLESIDDNDAPVVTEKIAASFEDDCPSARQMLAATAAKKSILIDDDDKEIHVSGHKAQENIEREQEVINSIDESGTGMLDVGTESSYELVDKI